ncbi:MAG: CPBP family intramembrane metalloprotease [Phycisphaerales bacterium]|nr:CPBP family intramembrane metalloprotease [Phycisphaerales bacterium]MCI0631570.1 CPBP family intramembrane metalloprotease [Phycisphaerales bacterium]MCI0675273.1 CPBP family intramembrane metalloprotease [Phycisphaerales bacterium]
MEQNPPIEPLEPRFPEGIPPGYPGINADRPGWVRRPRGFTGLAWIVIAACVIITLGIHAFVPDGPTGGASNEEDDLGVALMELQSKYLVGVANWSTVSAGDLNQYGTLDELEVGTVDQRLRYIILLAELQGADAAAEALQRLEDDIERAKRKNPEFELTESQEAVLKALRTLHGAAEEFTDESSDAAARDQRTPDVDALSQAQRDLLVKELGWFGKLALAPPQTDDTAAREAVLKSPRGIFYFAVGGIIALIALGLLGFIGLVVLIVLALTGQVRSNFAPSPVHHGLYAETFAAWMVVFLALQVVGGLVGAVMPEIALIAVGLAFFASLVTLGWPVFRGVPWRQVRIDAGWFAGPKPALEPVIGIGGYVAGLPIVAVGVIITLALFLIQQQLAGEGELFDPVGGPAHPIVSEIIDSNWWVRGQLLFLGSVAAPIVEETMFRGVLYRHLRDATSRTGILTSIGISTLINSFIFAVIHPQGWLAVPALMSLAIAFSLTREWRGSLIPSMIMHGIQNFLVFATLIVALSL